MNPESDAPSSVPEGAPRHGAFVTTRWSLVVTAARQDTSRAQAALESLCRTYWPPLFCYVRRRGFGVEDAQDLTQAFFAKLLEHQWLASAEQEKGRFRTFLLTAMERFLANEWDKVKALKRGGGHLNVPIQVDSAKTRYGVDPQDSRTPEQAFEYHWAMTLLDEVLKQLEAEHHARGQESIFARLKSCLVGERDRQPYAELANELGLSETALKVTVHRLRQRYRELLRAEIAQTVESATEVDAEMKYLFGVLSRGG